jgi:hypothetical protein
MLVLCLACAAPAWAGDGDQDPTFGLDGVRGPDDGYRPRAAAVLPDQDVAIVGTLTYAFASAVHVAWLRMSNDGVATTECGKPIPFLATFDGRAVLVDRNGNLVVGGTATLSGTTTQQRALVARFAASDTCDTLDTAWSDTGFELLGGDFCDFEDCYLSDLAEAPTAVPRLFALFEQRSGAVSRYFVIAFQSSGHVNPLFGVDGYAEVTATGLGTLAAGGARLAVDGLGRPLVLATRFDPDAPTQKDAVLLRFTTTGGLDTSFESVGFHEFGDDKAAAVLVIAPEGAIIVAANSVLADRAGWVYHLLPDGTWKGGGTGDSPVAAIALQGDGKVLRLANSTAGDGFVIHRDIRRSDGLWAHDPSFGSLDGHDIYGVNFGGANGQHAGAMVIAGGRPIVVGTADTDGADAMFAIRLRNGYLFADGFEVGSRADWSTAR